MEGTNEMTPADLMNSCCDQDTVPAYRNEFWTVTQEELERFHRRAQAQALREAADQAAWKQTQDYLNQLADELEAQK